MTFSQTDERIKATVINTELAGHNRNYCRYVLMQFLLSNVATGRSMLLYIIISQLSFF